MRQNEGGTVYILRRSFGQLITFSKFQFSKRYSYQTFSKYSKAINYILQTDFCSKLEPFLLYIVWYKLNVEHNESCFIGTYVVKELYLARLCEASKCTIRFELERSTARILILGLWHRLPLKEAIFGESR